MKKLIYKNKVFSDMTKEQWISKYCKIHESKNEFMPDEPWILVTMNDFFLTSSTSLDKILGETDQINLLMKLGINQVGSTFKKDEYHEYPVANIGFSPKDQKWYGWSHRAVQGFGIGDTPKEFYPDKTVEGQPIKSLEEAKEAASKFAESVA